MGNGNTRSALRAKEYVRYLEVIKLNIEIGLNLQITTDKYCRS